MIEKSESSLKKNLPLLLVLTLSASFIYTLPYARSYYYDAFKAAFNMTNTEMGLCGTYYGLFGAFSYLIGGVIADKVSIKKLLPFSLIATGASGFLLMTKPSPEVVAMIHGLWGITSLMTFWPALLKAIRLLANSNEQGKAFGLFEGGRGISNAVYLAIAAAIFAAASLKGNEQIGIMNILLFYSAITTILGILMIFLIRNVDTENSAEKSSFNVKAVGRVLKSPAIWLMSGIIFCTYSMNMSFYYISPFASAALGTSALFAAILSSASQYVRPLSSFAGGFLADRINSSKVMLIGQAVMLLGVIMVIFTQSFSTITVIVLACLLIYLAQYMCQSMHFALMEEVDIDPAISGTAIGIICFLGYLPESICPLVAGKILDAYTGTTGYQIYFVTLAAVIAVGIVFTLIWLRMTKAKRAAILAINQHKNSSSAQ